MHRVRMNIPEYVRIALDRLEAAGFEAYLVGGCVRDALLGQTPEDYDIATSALPAQTLALFEGDYKVVSDGMKHGTLAPVIAHRAVEITTFRTDGAYSDNRHPDSVHFSAELREDLARRDFTVNAMAYNEKKGLIDLYGGMRDLEAGIIRCVGAPDKRFAEDALRIIRALRFSAVLGFAIEKETADSIFKKIESIKSVSAERIYAEIKKLLDGDFADKALEAFPCFLKTLFGMELGAQKMNALAKNNGYAYRLAIIFQGENLQKLQILKPDKKTFRYVQQLVQAYALPLSEELTDSRKMAEFVFETQLDTQLLTDLLLLHADLDKDFYFGAYYESYLSAVAAELPMQLKQLRVNGEDLKRCGLEGKAIQQALEALLKAVVRGECENNKAALLEHITNNA